MNEKDSLNRLFDRLYPIMRSITGPGLEQSLNIFKDWRPEHLRMIYEYNNDNIVDLVFKGKITGKTPKIIRQF